MFWKYKIVVVLSIIIRKFLEENFFIKEKYLFRDI